VTTSAGLAVTLIGLAIFLAGCRQQIADSVLPPAPPTPQRTYEGRVVGITDGDTIKVLVDKTEHKVRLEGIDCPESRQPFSKAAKQFTADFCFGRPGPGQAAPP
jgi:endonuclease YncB( thermonuclease family)